MATSKENILAITQNTEATAGPRRGQERLVGYDFESRMSVVERQIVQ